LAMHRTEPAQPHQFGNLTGILAIGLHRHDLERIAHRTASLKARLHSRASASPHEAIATAPRPPTRSASSSPPAIQTRRSRPRARSPPCLPARSCRSHRSRKRLNLPKTRRFPHNSSWSFRDDTWSSQRLTPVVNTISLRDDHTLTELPG